MKVNVIYAQAKRQLALTVEVPDGATVQEAIEHSGVLTRCPEVDLEQQKVGIFGKVTALTTVVSDGDRVEIYRPLIADPKAMKNRTKTDSAAAAQS